MVFKVNNNNEPSLQSKETFTKLYVPPAKRNLNNVGLSKYFDCKFKVCTYILYTYILDIEIIFLIFKINYCFDNMIVLIILKHK